MVDPLRYEPDKADRPQSGCPFAQSANELAKSGTHGVAFLGIVGRTTTFVARLVIIPITGNAPMVGLFRGSLSTTSVEWIQARALRWIVLSGRLQPHQGAADQEML